MYYNWQIKFHSPPPSLYHINYCNYVLSLSPPKEKWVRWTVLHSPFEDTIKCILNVWHFIFAEWKWSQRNAMRVKVVRELLWCLFIFIKVRGLKISLSYPNSRSDLISRQSDSRMIDSNWNAFFFSLFSPRSVEHTALTFPCMLEPSRPLHLLFQDVCVSVQKQSILRDISGVVR